MYMFVLSTNSSSHCLCPSVGRNRGVLRCRASSCHKRAPTTNNQCVYTKQSPLRRGCSARSGYTTIAIQTNTCAFFCRTERGLPWQLRPGENVCTVRVWVDASMTNAKERKAASSFRRRFNCVARANKREHVENCILDTLGPSITSPLYTLDAMVCYGWRLLCNNLN